jgi:hypothetical protein
MPSLAGIFSIWVGMVIVGMLMGSSVVPGSESSWTTVGNALMQVSEDPIRYGPQIIVNAFTGPTGLYLVGALGVGGGAAVLSAYMLGGGFSLLFAIPLIIITAVIELFALPTVAIFSSALPPEVKMIYELIMGGMIVLTVVSFTAGR